MDIKVAILCSGPSEDDKIAMEDEVSATCLFECVIRHQIKKGDVDGVRRMTSKPIWAELSAMSVTFIVFYAMKLDECNHEIMCLLLTDPRAQVPTGYNNDWAVIHAVRTGDLAAMRLLAADKRIDLGSCENKALRRAARDGDHEMVRLLLEQQDVDPTARNNEALSQAISNEHGAVVDLLLADARVDAMW